jgi:hypothetical protein
MDWGDFSITYWGIYCPESWLTSLIISMSETLVWASRCGYTHKNLTSCNRFVNKPSTSCVRTACHKLSTSLEQAVNNLWQPCWYYQCYEVVPTSRIQSWYNNIVTTPCVVNLVTYSCLSITVSVVLEQPCNKSDNANKLKPVPNLLQQLETSSANTTCRQLVNRFVTTCFQTCNNLCVFTCVSRVYIEVVRHV